MQHRWMLLVGVALLAGCLQSGTQGTPEEPGPSPLDPALVVGIDRPLLDERVRAREIDVATDPNNPMHLAAVMMVPYPTQYALAPADSMQWTGLALSDDGGVTWEYEAFPGYPGDSRPAPFEGAVALGDGVLQFLPDGRLLMAVLPIRAPLQIAAAVAVFEWGSFEPAFVTEFAQGAIGLDGQQNVPTTQPGPHVDKEQVFVDQATGHIYYAYSERWQQSSEARIMFTKSTDGGRTFADPFAIYPPFPIYIGSMQHQMAPWPILTTEGQLVIVWADLRSNTLYISESMDLGESFEEPRVIAQHPGFFIPSVDVDRTGGPHHGSIYVAIEDSRNGDGDVYLMTSRDQGQSWDDSVRVNQDAVGNGRDHRMPELVVEPDGAVSVIYMAELGGATDWNAFVSRSIDGGRTFTEYKVSSQGFDPANFNSQPSFLTHMGDYIGISYNPDGVVAVWQDGRMSTTTMPYSEAWAALLPTRA